MSRQVFGSETCRAGRSWVEQRLFRNMLATGVVGCQNARELIGVGKGGLANAIEGVSLARKRATEAILIEQSSRGTISSTQSKLALPL